MASEEMQRAFVAGGGVKPSKPKGQRAPNSTLALKSIKQQAKDKRWAEIRFAFLMCQLRGGGYFCHGCGRAYSDPSKLQLNHIDRRSRGGAYTADNAELLGTGPGTCRCHERADGALLHFSGGRES